MVDFTSGFRCGCHSLSENPKLCYCSTVGAKYFSLFFIKLIDEVFQYPIPVRGSNRNHFQTSSELSLQTEEWIMSVFGRTMQPIGKIIELHW